MSMGETIRQLRKERGLTQEQLAEVMGVSIPAISKWETGQSAPELNAVVALADFFCVSVDCLVGHRIRREELDGLLDELDRLQQAGDFSAAADMAEHILQTYPNHYDAVDACANAYYAAFIQTQSEVAIRRSLELVQRLFPLLEQTADVSEYELRCRLANHRELMGDYVGAMHDYEKSNLSGSQDRNIARCLMRLGKPAEALALLSKEILTQTYRTFHDVTMLIELYQTMGQPEKAVAAARWGIGMIEGLPREDTLFTAKLLTFLYADLYALSRAQGLHDEARCALDSAARHARFWDSWTEESPSDMAFLNSEETPQVIESAGSGMHFLRTIVGYLDENTPL